MTWLALEPPISMFAPPDVGGAPRRVPLICMTCQEAKQTQISDLAPARYAG